MVAERIVTTRRSAVSFRRGAEDSPELFICRYVLGFLLETNLVYIAPHPILTGFKGFDNWMTSRFKMFCGVLVLRIVTAADMSAGQA